MRRLMSGFLTTVLLCTASSSFAQSVSLSVSKDFVNDFEGSIITEFIEKNIFQNEPENAQFSLFKASLPIYMLSNRNLIKFSTIQKNISELNIPNIYSISFNSPEQIQPVVQKETIWTEPSYSENTSKTVDYEDIIFDATQITLEEAKQAYENKNYILSQKLYQQILKNQQDNVFIIYQLGNISFETKNYSQALNYDLKAIKLNPYSAEAYFKIAQTLEKINKNDLAVKYYKISLELDSSLINAKKAIERLSSPLTS